MERIAREHTLDRVEGMDEPDAKKLLRRQSM
jgi:hypothetical protein